MRKRKFIFFAIHIVFPMILGAAVYYFLFPEVRFVRQIDNILGVGVHIGDTVKKGGFGMMLFRNYLPDMMWGYALLNALFFIIGNDAAGLWKAFGIAALFSIVIEMLQLTPILAGTFDVWDIAVEILAEIVAVIIIKITIREDLGYAG